MKRVALSEITQSIDYGVTASANNSPVGPKFLRITDIQDGRVDWASVPFCDADVRKLSSSRLKSGDIVFARTGATTGKSFLIKTCPANAVFASYLIRVRPNALVDSGFLAHFFDSPDYWTQISLKAVGAAQPGINSSKLKGLEVPLPPLGDQKRIAAILDQADALRRKRRKALMLLENLPQAVFADMFHGSQRFPEHRINEVCKLVTDGTHYTPTYAGEGVIFLSAKNVTSGYIDWENIKYIPQLLHLELQRRVSPRMGDILLAKNGTTGVAAIVDRDVTFDIYVSLALLRPNDAIQSVYLLHAVNSLECRKQFHAALKGIGVPNLHLVDIRRAQIPVPPLSLQALFAERIKKIEILRSRQLQHLARLETLFASLQHEVFSGALISGATERELAAAG